MVSLARLVPIRMSGPDCRKVGKRSLGCEREGPREEVQIKACDLFA